MIPRFIVLDLNEASIYKDAYYNNIDLILNLTKESFLYQFLVQFDSSSSINLKNKNEKACLVSLLTQNQIKFDLIKSFCPYIIRIDFKTKYKAVTFLDSKISVFNEKNIFGKRLKIEELNSKNDTLYQKRSIISFLFKHERMTHIKKILNKSDRDYEVSPVIYYNFEINEYFILKTKLNSRPEIGDSFEYLISNGNIDLIEYIFKSYKTNVDLSIFYNNDIWLDKTNEKLLKVLNHIKEQYDKYTIEINAQYEEDCFNEHNSGRYIFLKNNIFDYKNI